MFPDDTIAAIATPLGEGGLAVIRLSGTQAFAIADKGFLPVGKSSLRSNHKCFPTTPSPPSPRRSAKAGWPSSAFPARRHLPSPIKVFYRSEKVRLRRPPR